MKYQKVTSTDFYKKENFESILKRLNDVQIDSQRKWGKMNTTQMLHHLNLAIGSGLGFYDLEDKSNFITRNIIKNVILNILKRFPINSKTPSTLEVKESHLDFEKEKEQLKEILTTAYQTKSDQDWSKHSYFGKMTRNEWGKLIMIHCNHHFLQFGC